MLVVPTLQLRDREFNPRFKKRVSETPVLSDLVSFKSRDTTTNQEFVEFGQNARFIKTGANSPDSLRATHQPHVKHNRGYRINAFYIKYGLGKSWVDIAQEWVDAQADDSKLKSIVNTYFGDVWEEDSDGLDPIVLLSRLESFDLVWSTEAPEMISVAAIDSGFNSDQAYLFCEQNRWCVPIKGTPGMARPLIEDKIKRNQRLRRRRKKGIT